MTECILEYLFYSIKKMSQIMLFLSLLMVCSGGVGQEFMSSLDFVPSVYERTGWRWREMNSRVQGAVQHSQRQRAFVTCLVSFTAV